MRASLHRCTLSGEHHRIKNGICKVMFEFIPIKPENVLKVWPFVSEGVKKVLNNSSDDYDSTQTLNLLISGNWRLLIGYNDKKYVGFTIYTLPTNIYGDITFFIVQSYIKEDAPDTIFEDGHKALTALAKQHKCKKMTFWTTRESGFQRRLLKGGWKTGYT